ncbi:MAG: sensor histidine kinase [Eggerthellaceae bacterium]|jgi:signal transduction histidine kinase
MRLKERLSNWRTWLIGSYILIVVAIAVLWGYSLYVPLNNAEESQQYESLEAVADSTGALLAHTDLDAQSALDAADDSDSIRLTAIAEDGTVLADTVNYAPTMENHSDRPEVKAALQGEVGRARRVSHTDGIEYLYVAELATYRSKTVVMRASTPVSRVNALAEDFRNTGIALMIATLFLSIIIGWIAFSHTSKPVGKLEQVRTDFVANASHELKTPVAGIQLLSESIDHAYRDGDYDMIPVFTARLKKESERLHSLVTSLLDLSRLESGGLSGRSNASTCELTSIVGTSFDAHGAAARSRGLEFVYNDHVAPDEDCRINLSPTDASLLVDNLIENAINYTEKGSVTIDLYTEKDQAVLKVADTGIGIPAIDQERIFERFYRCDKARSRELGGTGLGLSLVRHAVSRANGHIDLDSTPGKGSTFTVTLPRA